MRGSEGSVRGERANFTGLALGCIEAKKNRTPAKKQADRSNAARPRGSKEKKCTRYSAQTMRVRTAPIQKIKSCNAGQSARVVQRAICSASASKNCTNSRYGNPLTRSRLKIRLSRTPRRASKISKAMRSFGFAQSHARSPPTLLHRSKFTR